MIQAQTLLRVSENSGARKVKCIKVLGGFKRRYARLGDLVVASIQSVKQHKKKKVKVKEGEVVQGLVVRTRAKTVRKNFSRLCYQENAIVLTVKKSQPIATRILGALSKEFRESKFMKLASLSSGFV